MKIRFTAEGDAQIKQTMAEINSGMNKTTTAATQMGASLRQTNPAFVSLNQIMQDAPYGIRGVGNNIQFLTQQFTQLRAGGMTTGQILKGMMQNALTPMGLLMFGVSAGTSLLTVAMDHLGKTTKTTNMSLEDTVSLLKEVEKLRFDVNGNIEQRRKELKRNIGLAQFGLDEARNPTPITKTTKRFVQGEGMVDFTETIKPAIASAETLNQLEKNLLLAKKESLDFEKSITKEKDKQIEGLKYAADAVTKKLPGEIGDIFSIKTKEDLLKAKALGRLIFIPGRGVVNANQISMFEVEAFNKKVEGVDKDVIEVAGAVSKATFSHLEKENNILMDSMQAGFRNVAYGIQDSFTKAFQASFGEANSLLEQFALAAGQELIFQLAGMAIGGPGAGLLGAIFGKTDSGATKKNGFDPVSNISNRLIGKQPILINLQIGRKEMRAIVADAQNENIRLRLA